VSQPFLPRDAYEQGRREDAGKVVGLADPSQGLPRRLLASERF